MALLVCGAVATVLVSAATALWVPEDPSFTGKDDNTNLFDDRERTFPTWHWQLYSMDAVSWVVSTSSRTAVPVATRDISEDWAYRLGDSTPLIHGSWPIHIEERDVFMNWSSAWTVRSGPMFEVRSGWPVAAMRSRRVTNWDDEKFTYATQCDGLEIPASSLGERMRFTLEGNSLNSPYRPVPLVPVWPGFAVCSVFWAGVIGAVWNVPGMVRGAVRRRRGLCAKCAYELRGLSACPECGTVTREKSKIAESAVVSNAPPKIAGGAA